MFDISSTCSSPCGDDMSLRCRQPSKAFKGPKSTPLLLPLRPPEVIAVASFSTFLTFCISSRPHLALLLPFSDLLCLAESNMVGGGKDGRSKSGQTGKKWWNRGKQSDKYHYPPMATIHFASCHTHTCMMVFAHTQCFFTLSP